MKLSLSRKQIIALLGVGFILVCIGIYVLFQSLNKNPNGDSVSIQGYDKKVKNLPVEYKDSFTAMLFKTIKYNSPEGKTSATITSINDAVIRAGSEKQNTVTAGSQYSGSFIVDIASIRQSYKVQYEYSTNPNDGFTSGYPLLISCLDASELLYGDFHCKDTFSQNNSVTDPIVGILPYSSLDFKIIAIQSSDGKVSLEITLLLSDSDRRSNIDSAIATYKNEAAKWIVSQGYDPTKYTINYIY
jgi:hypothetical protein